MSLIKSPAPLVVCMLAAIAGDGDKADQAKTEPPPMVRDSRWQPAVGDKAEAVTTNAPTTRSYVDFLRFQEFRAAKDQTGIEGELKSKRVVPIPKGTAVLVVKLYRPESSVFVAPAEATARIMQQALGAAQRTYPVEIRILAGDLKGQLRFASEDDIGRMIPLHEPDPPDRPKAVPKPINAAARAASMLRSAQNLEKAGKTAGAIVTYRQVVKDFPGTEQAKAAAARVKALTK